VARARRAVFRARLGRGGLGEGQIGRL
jgi:hypothetical protein